MELKKVQKWRCLKIPAACILGTITAGLYGGD
jgi:hypothetical protein